MGTLNIEWINLRADNATVGTQKHQTPVDVKSIDFTDPSFEVMTGTSSASADSGTPPTDATHALVGSVGASHYIRIGTAPTTTTGGVYVPSGGFRYIAVTGDDAASVLKVCTTT